MPTYPLQPCINPDCDDETAEIVWPAAKAAHITCPGCGGKREQNYQAKNVRVDDEACKQWSKSEGLSVLERWGSAKRAREVAPMFADPKYGGSAEVANCIQTSGPMAKRVIFPNRKVAKKYREVRDKLEAAGKVAGAGATISEE
jgi:hypothetical protein